MQTFAGTLNRRRDLGQILRDAFAFYRADWRGFATIGSGTIPFALLSSAVLFAISDSVVQQLAQALVLLVSLAPLAVVEGAVIAHLLALDSRQAPIELRSFQTALKRAPSLVGALLRLLAVCVLLSLTLVGLPVAVWLLVRWVFIPQAVMLDGANAAGALSLSTGFVKGHWWRTLGRVGTVALLVLAVNFMVLGFLSSGPVAVYALVSAILGAFTTPYFSIALTLAYFDLKARKAEAEPE
jgi:hypothetical protein